MNTEKIEVDLDLKIGGVDVELDIDAMIKEGSKKTRKDSKGSVASSKHSKKEPKKDYASHDAFLPDMNKFDKTTRSLWYTTANSDATNIRNTRDRGFANMGALNCKDINGPNALGGGKFRYLDAKNLTDRTATQFSKDFGTILPLGGKKLNDEASAFFKSNSTSTAIGKAVGKQNNVSVTHSDYPLFPLHKLKNAKGTPFRPTIQKHVKTDQKFHTDPSVTQETFNANVDEVMMKMVRGISCRQKNSTHLVAAPFCGQSRYEETFVPLTDFKRKFNRDERNMIRKIENRNELAKKIEDEEVLLGDMIQYSAQ